MTRALTFSSSVNAWTLKRACAALGVRLETTDEVPLLRLPVADDRAGADWLLFTEEASLAKALRGELSGRFLPRRFPLDLLDDKWAFAEWLALDGEGPRALAQWSLTSVDGLRLPVLLKAKHSWVGDRKLPRGWICRSLEEARRTRRRLESEGLAPEWFFFQEWLGSRAMRLLSVCGFFDAANPSRNLTCVVERVADSDAEPSCSAAVATVPDPRGLTALAARVLKRLDFVGPFEMEFILTEADTFALELNPRFWLQHGLFLAAGNGLLKRYFGLDGSANPGQAPPEGLLWLDGLWLARSALTLDLRKPFEVFGRWWRTSRQPPLLYPPPATAAVGLARWALRKGFRHQSLRP